MTDTDDTSRAEEAVADSGEDSGEKAGSQDATESSSRWDVLLDAVRTRLHDQIAVWPEKVTATIDLVEDTTSSDVPADGDILVYVHGYLGEGRLDGMNISGANQAAALREALADEFDDSSESPPTVVAAIWNSSTIWPRATSRAVTAGKSLAGWLRERHDDYDRVTVVGHSLGGQVVFAGLNHVEDGSVDSVGLLGAAVPPERVYSDYRDGIESAVDGGVFNYHSRNDSLVCRLYRFRERTTGIGCNGTLVDGEKTQAGLPDSYVDVDVTETVHRHMDYFKPVPETAAGNAVGELVERQLAADSTSQ